MNEEMRTFGECRRQEHEFDYDILQNAEEIKQDIIERNRDLGGENGYDFESMITLKGEYGKPENRIWIRVLPNFDTKSAKLTVVRNDSWSLNLLEIVSIETAKDLLRKWDIEEYAICNANNQFLEYFQPLDNSAR